MITRFQVKNYKLLKDVDVPLTPIHVIVGQNDSGKTTLLEAVRNFCRMADEGRSPLSAFGSFDPLQELVYFRAEVPIIGFGADLVLNTKEISFSEYYQLQLRIFSEPQLHIEILDESVKSGQANFSKNHSGPTGVSTRKQLGQESFVRYHLEHIANTLLPVNFYLFDPRALALPAVYDVNRKFRMDENGFGLATLLDDIVGYDPQRFLDLSREFHDYFPEFLRVRLETTEHSKHSSGWREYPAKEPAHGKQIYLDTANGATLKAGQTSDGVLLFLGFLALLYSPKPPRILLIEEPERGVYPKRLAEIIGILKRLVEPSPGRVSPQIILTTHSPYLLSFFQPEEVTLMSRRGDHAIARPLSTAPNIHELLSDGTFYLGELWYNLDEASLFSDANADRDH